MEPRMFERTGLAICKIESEGSNLGLCPKVCGACEARARAVLEAMRSPPRGLIDAAKNLPSGQGVDWADSITTFDLIIDAALRETHNP